MFKQPEGIAVISFPANRAFRASYLAKGAGQGGGKEGNGVLFACFVNWVSVVGDPRGNRFLSS